MKRLFFLVSLFLIFALAGGASAQIAIESPWTQDPAAAGMAGLAGYQVNLYWSHLEAVSPDVWTYYTNTYFYTYGSQAVSGYLMLGQAVLPMYGGSITYGTPGSPSYGRYWGFSGMGADAQGVVEFELPESYMEALGVTSKNFTARLGGLTAFTPTVIGPPGGERRPGPYSFTLDPAGTMHVGLYDLGDGYEDGEVTPGDFNQIQGDSGPITTRTHVFESETARADFKNVNVTAQIRRDLFGDGVGEGNFTGFILKSPDARNQVVGYDLDASPALTITVVEVANVTCGNCAAPPTMTTPAIPGGAPASFTAQTAVSFTATVTGPTADLSIAFASLPENTVFYKVVNGVYTEIYPDNQTTCITNVTLDSDSKVLSFTIADDSDCDADGDPHTPGTIQDPVVAGSGASGASGGASGNSGCFIDTVAK